jgi:hypothetical protein
LLIPPATDLCLLHVLSVLFQPSFDKVVSPSFLELGLAELVSIYNDLRELGRAPPVIDSADLQRDPEVLYLSNYARFIIKSFVCIKFEHNFILLTMFPFLEFCECCSKLLLKWFNSKMYAYAYVVEFMLKQENPF